jgi:hypothetical protein
MWKATLPPEASRRMAFFLGPHIGMRGLAEAADQRRSPYQRGMETMTRFGLISVLLLCACGQQGGQGAQGEASAEPNANHAGGRTAALPDYLPDYPNSTRVEVPNLGAPGTDSRSGNAIAMETDATPAEVAQFYRARFAEAGVPIRMDTANAEGGLISVARDGERGAMLTISRVGGKTRIGVIRAAGGR